MSKSTWEALTRPSSICIVGVSRNEGKLGRRLLGRILKAGFPGEVHAVNAAAEPGETVDGVPLLRSVTQIAGGVDLAHVALPAELAVKAAAECASSGARCIVVPASGFGEVDARGAQAEDDLRTLAARDGVRILGPNCFGVFSSDGGFNLTPFRDIPKGQVALLAQSGNLSLALFILAGQAGIGFSSCVGLGNQVDISFGELLAGAANDAETRAVALYIEGIPPGQASAFMLGLQACREADKPVIVLKAGRSARSAEAAMSHTRAIASDDRAFQAVLDTHGAIRAMSTEHCIDLLVGSLRVRRTTGRVMVLSDGGGDSVAAVDALAAAELPIAVLTHQTHTALDDLVPRHAPRVASGNPATLDTPGGLEDDPLLLARCMEVVRRDAGVDVILITGLLGGYAAHRDAELECSRRIIAAHTAGSNVIVHTSLATTDEAPVALLKAGGVPVFSTVQRLVEALRHRVTPVREGSHADSHAGSWPRASAGINRRGAATALRVTDAAKILTSAGITLPPMQIVSDRQTLRQLLETATFPACLKIADVNIAHKSDVHGVWLNLTDTESTLRAADMLWRDHPDSELLLMPMLAAGLELLTGFRTDPAFGPLVAVGRGGIWTEVEADTALLLAPTDEHAVLRALEGLRCWPMLSGFRNQPRLDVQSLCQLVMSLSRLAERSPDITADLNPTILYRSGYAVADIRMLKSP